FPLRLLHGAVAGGIDRGTGLGREIDAGVQLAAVEDGVDAPAEAARHLAAALQRTASEEALAGLAFWIEEIDGAVAGAEAEQLAHGAAELEADIEQLLMAGCIGFSLE